MISSAFLFFSHLTWLTSLNCLVLLFPFASLPTDRDPSLITIYIPCVSIHFFPDNTVIFPDSVTRPYKLTNFQLSFLSFCIFPPVALLGLLLLSCPQSF